MSLSPAFLDELRARTLLSALVGKTVKLTRAGREWRACCPFHDEKTPSFYVNDAKGFYHCFGCSAHGDAIRWLTDQRGLPFMDAVKELASTANMELPAPDPREAQRQERAAGLHDVMAAAETWFTDQLNGVDGGEARAYLVKRGISPDLAQSFGIGFAPDSRGKLKAAMARFGDSLLVEAGLLIAVDDKEPYDRFRGRVMIPIRDPRGRTIGFGGRILGAGEPKYLNSPDTPLFDKGRTLWNLDKAAGAARKANRLIVVEGYMDAIALAGAGVDEVVAPNGTALTEHQIERLWRVVDVPIVCFDGDAAGQKAAVRAAQRAMPLLDGTGQSLNFAMLLDGQDPDDIVREGGAEAFEVLIKERRSLVDLLWNFELEAASFDTPESRSLFGTRLREYAKLVQHEDVRAYYFAEFAERVESIFVDRRGGLNPKERGYGTASRPVPEVLAAIAKHGMTRVSYAPAVLAGWLRFPEMLAPYAEVLAEFHALFTRRDFRLLCRAMLDAALTEWPLDRDRLNTILREDGLAPAIDGLVKRKPLPFSFVRMNSPPETAKQDLASVLDALAEGPELQAAMRAAQLRLTDAEGDGLAEMAEIGRIGDMMREVVERVRDQLELESS